VDKINSLAGNSDKMRGLSGHSSDAELAKDMFTLLGILELYSSAYIEADCFFARTHSMSTVANPPRDRLLCYLQLISHIKRAAVGGGTSG